MTLTRLIRQIHQESDRLDHDLVDEWKAKLWTATHEYADAMFLFGIAKGRDAVNHCGRLKDEKHAALLELLR